MIRILTIGKKHEAWIEPGILRYQKRLKKPFDAQWQLLPHSQYEGDQAREEESERLLGSLSSGDFVILLDERGELFTSPALSRFLETLFSSNKKIVCVIGGAYGVNKRLRERANMTWSLSSLVFPHQLVRLMLIEQLYRAQEIAAGGSYHHS